MARDDQRGRQAQTMWNEFLGTFGTDRKGGGTGMSGVAERVFVLTFEL